MKTEQKTDQTTEHYSKNLPILGHYDVIVCGG
jgi:hypothetical protein